MRARQLIAAVMFAGLGASAATPGESHDERPNFVVVLADDMGFSDPGCFGGEIRTPHLDALASGGLRFTQFYNAARCCPTRASLLTGLYPHQAGMAENGQTLSRHAATLAEVLRTAGYQTGMAGKWHLSRTAARESMREQLDWLSHRADFGDFAPRPSYPSNRGFDQHWGVIWGVVNHFDPFSLVHNEEPIREVPEGFYMTDFITDKAVEMIDQFSKADRPFLLYVAHTAPHWPLHAPETEVASYRGMYDGGWEALRQSRYQRQLAAGLFDRETTPLPANSSGKAWPDCRRQDWEAAHMEVHAAMVTRMDRGIGRVVAKLEDSGELDNTLILFLSDNGASPERGYPPGFDRPGSLRDGTPIRYDFDRPGPTDTWGYLGAAWASAANTPFRYWKKESFEGGICTPTIVHWPRGLATRGGAISTAVCHVMDVMPTLLELAGAEHPTTLDGRPVMRLEGRSLVPILRGRPHEGHEALYWEHDGGRAVRQGNWKLASLPDGEWELFDLATDRSESKDRSAEHPEKVARLAASWTAWWKRTAPHPDLELFLDAASPDEERAEAALLALREVWRDDYAALLVELARFMAPRQREDPTARVRERLVRFLGEQTGQDFGDELRDWRRWYWSRPYHPHPDYAAFKAALYSRVDERMGQFFPAGGEERIRLDEIDWGGVRVNGIPPLDHPKHLRAEEAGYLEDEHVVFGVEVNGEARAYPKRILAWHELALDRLGGVELTVVYCTLCGTVIPYGAEAGGKHYTFGTSGLLYRSNKLMFDHETMSLWSTMEGRPMVGSLAARHDELELQAYPVVTTTWREWRALHPETTVLSLDTGHERDYSEGAAYRSHFGTDELMFEVPTLDERLKNKASVLALRLRPAGGSIGDEPRALALSASFLMERQNRVFHRSFAGHGLVIVTSPDGANRVYDVGETRFVSEAEDGRLRDTSGGSWRLAESALVPEADGVSPKPRVPARRVFWFAWQAMFPDTELVK